MGIILNIESRKEWLPLWENTCWPDTDWMWTSPKFCGSDAHSWCKMLYLLRQDQSYETLVSWTAFGIQNGFILFAIQFCATHETHMRLANGWESMGKPCRCSQFINKLYLLLQVTWSTKIHISTVCPVCCIWMCNEVCIIKSLSPIVPTSLVATGIAICAADSWADAYKLIIFSSIVLWWCLYYTRK